MHFFQNKIEDLCQQSYLKINKLYSSTVHVGLWPVVPNSTFITMGPVVHLTYMPVKWSAWHKTYRIYFSQSIFGTAKGIKGWVNLVWIQKWVLTPVVWQHNTIRVACSHLSTIIGKKIMFYFLFSEDSVHLIFSFKKPILLLSFAKNKFIFNCKLFFFGTVTAGRIFSISQIIHSQFWNELNPAGGKKF